jgi:hypothetical protein
MGGSMGNPIDEAAQARINQKIEDVVKTFGIEFSKAYTQVVINKAKAEVEAEPSLEDECKLQDAPVPSAILKSGQLVKVSEFVQYCSFVSFERFPNLRLYFSIFIVAW